MLAILQTAKTSAYYCLRTYYNWNQCFTKYGIAILCMQSLHTHRLVCGGHQQYHTEGIDLLIM